MVDIGCSVGRFAVYLPCACVWCTYMRVCVYLYLSVFVSLYLYVSMHAQLICSSVVPSTQSYGGEGCTHGSV